MLKQASAKKRARILVVFDQFEEILISAYVDEQLQAIRSLIGDLVATHASDILVLISVRSDYIGILEQLKLPRLELGVNWIEISAFSEQASRDFLQRSGLQITSGLMENIVSQARDIEETKGLVRPVTLNMIGLSLAAQATVQVDVVSEGGLNRLIMGYVSDSLRQSEIRPFATKVVSQMLAGKGLKRALRVRTISKATRLPEAAVNNTLLLLSTRGACKKGGPGQRCLGDLP